MLRNCIRTAAYATSRKYVGAPFWPLKGEVQRRPSAVNTKMCALDGVFWIGSRRMKSEWNKPNGSDTRFPPTGSREVQ
jgi:hypothetical protein